MVGQGAWLVWLVGCGGPSLAELEVQQASLEREVEVLRRHVSDMRGRLQDMKVIPKGPAAAAAEGPSVGLTELSFTVARTGTVPAPFPLGAPERREGTDCGWRFVAQWLEAVSDISLEKSGSGKSSPILLRQNGSSLSPHAAAPKFEHSCTGSFRMQPKYAFFSPWSEDDVDGTWDLVVDEAIPIPRSPDGRGMYWIFPGTTLTFTIAGVWDPAWGSFGIEFDARLLSVGTPDHPTAPATAAARVVALGEERTGTNNRLGLALQTEPPDADPWTVEITSPPGGPWILVETLLVGNEDRALVVTAEGQ